MPINVLTFKLIDKENLMKFMEKFILGITLSLLSIIAFAQNDNYVCCQYSQDSTLAMLMVGTQCPMNYKHATNCNIQVCASDWSVCQKVPGSVGSVSISQKTARVSLSKNAHHSE